MKPLNFLLGSDANSHLAVQFICLLNRSTLEIRNESKFGLGDF